MRELGIRIEYDAGVDPVADVFIDHPELVLESVDVAVDEGVVRVDHVSGPEAALSDLRSTYLDPRTCNECVVDDDRCDADRSYEVLDAAPNDLTLYTFHEAVTYCHSVPYHAAVTLRPGTLYNATRRGHASTWRLLVRDDERTTDLYDALADSLPDGVSMSFRHLTTPEHWGRERTGHPDLSPEQRATIERAIELSYYGYPRGCDIGDLAADLGVPRSTARYRLRRAERALVAAYSDD